MNIIVKIKNRTKKIVFLFQINKNKVISAKTPKAIFFIKFETRIIWI